MRQPDKQVAAYPGYRRLGNRRRQHGTDEERREAMLKARDFELRFLHGGREAFWNKERHVS